VSLGFGGKFGPVVGRGRSGLAGGFGAYGYNYGSGYFYPGVLDGFVGAGAPGGVRTIIIRHSEPTGMLGIRDAPVLPPVVYVIGAPGRERVRPGSRSSRMTREPAGRRVAGSTSVRVVEVRPAR
jgi:hypothetical protein